MSYSFPYALGICLATLALLGALTWLYALTVQAAADWMARREHRNAARNAARRNAEAKREAEAEAAFNRFEAQWHAQAAEAEEDGTARLTPRRNRNSAR